MLCAGIYQGRKGGPESILPPKDAAALLAFFTAITTGKTAAQLSWTAVTYPGNPSFDKAAFAQEVARIEALRGNAGRGKDLWKRACAFCHENELGPPPKKVVKHADRLVAFVRGGSESMPFFSRDKLTDQDVADIRAFVLAGM